MPSPEPTVGECVRCGAEIEVDEAETLTTAVVEHFAAEHDAFES